MNCDDIRTRLLAWHYEELPAAEQAEVARHVDGCGSCREQSLAWQELGRKLDTLRVPAAHVELPRLFQQAVQRQERRLRGWRRTAAALVAAAAVGLIAVGLKLQIRMEASQVVVSWGNPPEAKPQVPELPSPPTIAPVQPTVSQVNPEDVQLVKDLVRALATEIQWRDHQQQENLLRLQARFEALLGGALDRWASNERDVAALYSAQFRLHKQGENP
jgi:anti-sigma factor RsiW